MTSATEIHVKIRKDSDTPIDSVRKAGESGIWGYDLDKYPDLTHIVIWEQGSHNASCRQLKAPITDVEIVKGGKVIKFDKSKSRLSVVPWNTHPKFNMIGCAFA